MNQVEVCFSYIFFLFVLESLGTSLVPASTLRCGKKNSKNSTFSALKSSSSLHSASQCCFSFRDKDEEVSLSQKLEEIKTNFNSLRRYYSFFGANTYRWPSKAGELFFLYLFRMIKEAKKEKGTDDFLGKVVLKLQVANVLIFISAILFFTVLPVSFVLSRFRISTVLKTTGTIWSPEQRRILIGASATWISSSSIKR